MERLLLKTMVLASWGFALEPAQASLRDMLSDRSLSRQVLDSTSGRGFDLSQSLFLLDGSKTAKSTGHITYDRSVHSLTQASTVVPFQPNFRGRLVVETHHSYEKEEGAQLPRRIVESKKQDSQVKAELLLASALGPQFLLGFQALIWPRYTIAFRAEEVTGDDRYSSFQKMRNYLGLIQQHGALQAGLVYESVLDEERPVERSNSRETAVYTFQDRVYLPARINLFARMPLGGGLAYSEISLIEASGGGPRNSLGGTLEEDFFRLEFAWTLPLGSKETSLENTLVYKAMSYADRQGVSFDTIPLTALHSRLRWEELIPLYAGFSYMRGHDTQSFLEFHTDYRIWGLGAELGTSVSF